MDSETTEAELYAWLCDIQNELAAAKAAFVPVLYPPRDTLVAAVSCLRIRLELRVTQPGARKAGTPPTGTGPRAADESLSRPY